MPGSFSGAVDLDIRDSTPDWAPFSQLVAPPGTPNVVHVVLDDVGAGGQLGACESRVLLQQVVRAADRVHHRSLRPRHSTAASTRSTNAASGTEPAHA